jgi:hypothetical protein
MKQRWMFAVLGVVGVVAAISLAGAVMGIGPLSPGSNAGERHSPSLQSFTSVGTHCTNNFAQNASTRFDSAGTTTHVTHRRNVSLPDTSYAIGNPTFEQLNESMYLLSVPIEQTEKQPKACQGVAQYTATMQIPAGDDPWQIRIAHDGTNVTTLFGDVNRSLVGGSASGGASVSN